MAPLPDEMEKILAGLKNIDIAGGSDDRPVLGDRQNIQKAVDKQRHAIVITDSTDASGGGKEDRQQAVLKKSDQLGMLRCKVLTAVDNDELARAVYEFMNVISTQRSKVLTKEGFGFLDALCKQLGDPSVFIAPLR